MTTPEATRSRRPLLIVAATLGWIAVGWGPVPRQASGHGDPLQIGYAVGSNRLMVAPTVYDNFNSDENFSFIPGFGLRTIYPGFARTDNLPAQAAVSLQLRSPLLYWNNAAGAANPLPVPAATITVMKDATTAALVGATSVTGSNPLPLGTFSGVPGEHLHFAAYKLINPDDVGLYGIWAVAEATGPNFSGAAAAASDPFLIVLNYGITSSDDYALGVSRLAALPVPEPAATVLAGLAVVAAIWHCRASSPRRGRGAAA